MTSWHPKVGLVVSLLLLWSDAAARSDEDKKNQGKSAENQVLTIVDNAGKEHKLKKWKWISGTTRLPWLAPPQAKTDPKKKPRPADAGPEVLVVREENSTDLRQGIVTYVPLDRLRSIEYDNENRSVTIKISMPAQKGDEEETLTGSTKYVGENKLSIEAESDLGDLGVATVKFQGGTLKSVKSIKFPAIKDKHVAAKGIDVSVTSTDKDKSVHKVVDLQPLYLLHDRSQRLIPTLLFKKTVKIDLAKIQKLEMIDSADKESPSMDFEVTLKTGKSHTLTLLDETSPLDGKAARLLGFVGKVAAGYKLFHLKANPNHTFTKIEFEKQKEKEKEKE